MVFKATSSAPLSATLSIQHSGVGSPQLMSLTGSGTTRLIFQPASLDFGMQPVGSSSQMWIGVGNNSSSPITIQSIALNGNDFQLGQIPSLAAGQQLAPFLGCNFPIAFMPSAQGTRTGNLTIMASDASTAHVALLTGVGGTAAGAALSVSALYFGFQNIGSSSAAQTLSLSSTGNTILNISNIAAPVGFAQTNTCPAALSPGMSCSISVTFTPTAAGAQSGTLTISDNASNSPQPVVVSGNATDFLPQSPSGSTTVSVTAGQTATYNLQITPMGAFTGTVSLQCTGAPAKTTCSVNPRSVIVSGSAVLFIVSVSTTAPSASSANQKRHLSFLAMSWLGVLVPWGVLLVRVRPSVSVNQRESLACLILGILIFVCSCGGGSTAPPPTPPIVQGTLPGTYSLTVTASSGTQSRPLSLSLTVK